MSWTKGPWFVDVDFTHTRVYHKTTNNDGNPHEPAIAETGEMLEGDVDVSSAKANAQLISAAPELYEALALAHQHLEYCGYGDKWERECARETKLEETILAALAKARGGV